jgi:prepilin-type N-terminal cleavage/methylation domain-containing protein
MNIKNVQKQKGFTLVEISIVLVIIGLLLGGVLKGQELIQNSKVKSVTADFNNISAAYYAYRDRTSSYPSAADDSAFWFALKDEGFITGLLGTSADSEGPTHALDGSFQVLFGGGANLIDGKAYICANNIDSDIAGNIDRKSDDGVSSSGSYRSVDNVANDTAVADGAAVAYNADPTVLVALCKEL